MISYKTAINLDDVTFQDYINIDDESVIKEKGKYKLTIEHLINI